MNEEAWRHLHRMFGKYHAMTDVFCDSTESDTAHDLPLWTNATLAISASDSFLDRRHRLIDGTYIWSHFLDDPAEDIYACIDRQSAMSFLNKKNSEISERSVNILSGTVDITFSIILGFEVNNDAGIKVVSVNSEEQTGD